MLYDSIPWQAGAIEADTEDNTPDEDTRTDAQKARDDEEFWAMAKREGWR